MSIVIVTAGRIGGELRRVVNNWCKIGGLRGLKDDLHTVEGLDSADDCLYGAANPDL